MAKSKICNSLPMEPKKIILAIVAFIIIAQVLHTVGTMATMSYYMEPAYTQVWSSIMMPTAAAPPISFYMYSIGFGAITALFFVMVYSIMGCCVPGKTLINRGMTYGLLIFLVGGLPGLLMTYLVINVPGGLVAAWAIEGLIINLLGGIATAYIIR